MNSLQPFEPQTIDQGLMVKMVSDVNIQYTNRAVKEKEIRGMKQKFVSDVNETITNARAAYTKVTGEKPRYRFGHNEIENINKMIKDIEIFNEDKKASKKNLNSSESIFQNNVRYDTRPNKTKKGIRIVDKNYDFKEINEFIYFNKEGINEDKSKTLKLRDIEKVGTPEFAQQYSDYQLSTDILELEKQIKENRPVTQQNRMIEAGKAILAADKEMQNNFKNFEPKLVKNMYCILVGNRSKSINIEYIRNFDNNKYKDYEKLPYTPLDMPYSLEDVNCFEMFSLAAGRYFKKQIQFYMKSQKTKQMNIKMQEDEGQIDRKYAELRQKIAELKRLRNQKKGLVKISNAAQTEKPIINESLNELIDINTQRTLQKLGNLTQIKEQIEDEVPPSENQLRSLMFQDIHKEMREQLFCLLLSIAKDQKFINYSEFFRGVSKEHVEDKILQSIYLNLDEIRNHLTRSRQKKINLLNMYLNMRKMIKEECQAIMQEKKGHLAQIARPKSKSPSKSPAKTPKKKPWV